MELKSTESEKDVFKLFLPELLTIEELTEILKARSVQDRLLKQDKAGLVSLFKRVAFPLPQREFPLNFRGKLIMKRRKKAERKRISESFASDTKSFMIVTSKSSKITEISKEKLVSDRLKPPPDMIKCEKKRIRLNSSSNSSVLDKIIIKRRKSSETSSDCSSPKLNESNVEKQQSKEDLKQDNSNEDKKLAVPKKVSLKRNFTSTVTIPKPEEEIKSTTHSEPEKKHQRITWP